MTVLALDRLTDFAGVTPARGTFPIAANVEIFKGAMVAVDVSGRVIPANTIANGALAAVGKASAHYNNLNGSELGGAAGACDVEVEYGVFGWASGAAADAIVADDVGKVCFMIDDQTVGLTNGTDTRGIAGFITEYRNGQVWVYMGPHVAGLIVIAASEASQLDTAQTDIDAAELRLDALETDATTAQAQVQLPLMSFVDGDGDPLVKWVNGGADGMTLVDSKGVCIRWNNSGAPTKFQTSVMMPQDYDDTAAVVMHFLASKVGATAADTPAFVIEAFAQTVGALHDADADFGGTSSAMTNQASKTVQEVSLSLAAGDVPASPANFTLTMVPNDIGTDDLCLFGVWLEYTRKQMAS